VPQTISNVIRERSALSRQLAAQIADALGISAAWLLFGEGELEPTTTTTTEAPPPSDDALIFDPRCWACGGKVSWGAAQCPRCDSYLDWPRSLGGFYVARRE